jgi:Fe2+ transport system protein FeoA
MTVTFRDLKKNKPAVIADCRCELRFSELGFIPGKEIEIVGECLLGDTVIIRTQSGILCVRRSELDIDLNLVEEG